jgi:hypothetical protein
MLELKSMNPTDLPRPVSIGKFSSLQVGSFLCYTSGMPFFEEQVQRMAGFSILRHRICMHMPAVEKIAYSMRIPKTGTKMLFH